MRRLASLIAVLPFVIAASASAQSSSAAANVITPAPRAPSAKRPWIGEACRSEFTTLCKDLPNDSRREVIVDCLKAHTDSLSHDCADAISDRAEQTPGMRPGRNAGHHGHRGGGAGGGWQY